jgi:hypothetical protein
VFGFERTTFFKGNNVKMDSSFRHVKHIGLKTKYRTTETYECDGLVNSPKFRL